MPLSKASLSYKVKESSTIMGPMIIAILAAMLFIAFEDFLTAVGLSWSLFLFLLFLNRLGKTFPILELMLLMAALQWIVGAWIGYQSEVGHWRYYMYVDEAEYMLLAVPGLLSFSFGVFMFYPKYTFQEVNRKLQDYIEDKDSIAFYLIGIGIISTYASPYVPGALSFVLFLTAAFQYVGLALLLFKPNSKSKWSWFLGVMGFLAVSSIIKGMFHDFFLWSILLSSFVMIQLKFNNFTKILFVTGGVVLAILVQSIKGQFREASSGLQDAEKVELFSDMLGSQTDGLVALEDESAMAMLNVRLNQGWIISSIIDNVPKNEPFAEGETIMTAIRASILPRILDPGKKMAGGKENFRRFTGIGIRDGTSMGTSVLGEAYGNYGYQGAWVFMFLWGVFLSFGYRQMMNYGNSRTIMYVFIPLVFLQVIKAETELYVVLNHFVKSVILVLGFLWVARKVLKWDV